jgi:hypothetical protein
MPISSLSMKHFKHPVVDLFSLAPAKKHGHRTFITAIRKNFHFHVGYIDPGLANYDLLTQPEAYLSRVLSEYSHTDHTGYH